jgi:hypothetical protein
MKTPASGRLDSPCGRIGGGFAAARQAQLAAHAPKREFHATFVGGHVICSSDRLIFSNTQIWSHHVFVYIPIVYYS